MGNGTLALSGMCFSCKHQNLSPSVTIILALGDGDRQIPGTCWPAWLAIQRVPAFVKDPIEKKKSEK